MVLSGHREMFTQGRPLHLIKRESERPGETETRSVEHGTIYNYF